MKARLLARHTAPLALALLLASCGQGAPTTDARVPTAAVPTYQDPVQAPTTATAAVALAATAPAPSQSSGGASANVTIPAAAQPLVDQAVADVAQRLKVAPGEVTIAAVTAMTWPGAQLGCGGAALDDETPTPGFRILLITANQQFDYHTSMQRVVWCDKRRS